MGRNVLIAVMLLMAVSCGLREVGGQFSDPYDDVWQGPGAEIKPGGVEETKKPECYTVMGTTPLAMVDGILHVGMTSVDGSGPAVWQDGEIKRLGFNGYISSISVWNP